MSDPTKISRRLVAVFAADVEGYSRLMGADELRLKKLEAKIYSPSSAARKFALATENPEPPFGTLRTRQRRHNVSQIELECVGEQWIRSDSRPEQALRLCAGLDERNPFAGTAGEIEIIQRLLVETRRRVKQHGRRTV
jgi:hypothetical protein